jgi:nucleoside-diphosphate-sugar epimerase
VKNEGKDLTTIRTFEKIVVIGASGWLGRECISVLSSILKSNFFSKVILFGSENKLITVNGQNFKIHSTQNLHSISDVDLIVDFAFLTQEKLKILGEIKYIEANLEIRNIVYNFIYESSPRFIYYASSGAADIDFLKVTQDNSKKLYGELKQASEITLEKIATARNTNLLINRIWSVTGRHIQNYTHYAIGNFFFQAMTKGKICVTQSDQILRTYIDAGDMLRVCFNKLFEDKLSVLNSGGFQTTLFNLASLVLKELEIFSVQIPNLTPKIPHQDYISKDFELNQLAIKYNLELHSLEAQIRNMSQALNT